LADATSATFGDEPLLMHRRTGAPIADRIHACRDILRLQPGNLDAQRMIHHLEITQRQLTAFAHTYSTPIPVGTGLTGGIGV